MLLSLNDDEQDGDDNDDEQETDDDKFDDVYEMLRLKFLDTVWHYEWFWQWWCWCELW